MKICTFSNLVFRSAASLPCSFVSLLSLPPATNSSAVTPATRQSCLPYVYAIINTTRQSYLPYVYLLFWFWCSGTGKGFRIGWKQLVLLWRDKAPIPLRVFRSNSKFHQNMRRSSLKYVQSITAKFCTRHQSYTVVMCTKFRCGW